MSIPNEEQDEVEEKGVGPGEHLPGEETTPA
jgi:hypothetical protein